MFATTMFEMTEVALSSNTSSPYVLCKRARGSSEAENVQGKKIKPDIIRPGIPPATPTNSFYVPNRPSPPLREDDKEGHYVYELGENLTSRYKILSRMGEGTFGRVLECWDRKTKEYVAIKIIRNIDKYRHAAMIELEVLNTVARNDPQRINNCLSVREWFDYRGHVCMVFDKLGPSLFDFLRKNEYRPFPVDLVQDFARQLVQAVAYMHECKLVHTDLKPENILLVSLDYCQASSVGITGRAPVAHVVPTSSAIKVIDFGSATFEEGYHSSVVSTRHYRAPEIILGTGWSYPCDMWSVGCILMELLTGNALFQTHDNLEHLAMMEAVLGPLPAAMVGRASKAVANLFDADNRLCWPSGAANKRSVRAVKKLSCIRRLILEQGDSTVVPYVDWIEDFIQCMLRYDPNARCTAAQARHHPFLSLNIPPSITLPRPMPPASSAVGQGQQGPGTVAAMGDSLLLQAEGCRGVAGSAMHFFHHHAHHQAQSLGMDTPSVAPGMSSGGGLSLLATVGGCSSATVGGSGVGTGYGW